VFEEINRDMFWIYVQIISAQMITIF
jgi:hypothetical protein